mmetsp:Transcript_25991/g.80299  ORF Transcript_25991/g.80299 Transcript_25991/m.80299 type:complete len:209 (-) Transcript_25991:483-1109(-)
MRAGVHEVRPRGGVAHDVDARYGARVERRVARVVVRGLRLVRAMQAFADDGVVGAEGRRDGDGVVETGADTLGRVRVTSEGDGHGGEVVRHEARLVAQRVPIRKLERELAERGADDRRGAGGHLESRLDEGGRRGVELQPGHASGDVGAALAQRRHELIGADGAKEPRRLKENANGERTDRRRRVRDGAAGEHAEDVRKDRGVLRGGL